MEGRRGISGLLRRAAQTVLGDHYYRLRVWRETRGLLRDAPVLVYQMGKVGSRTIVDSLRSRKRRFCVLHVHTLTEVGIQRGEVKRRADMRGTADYLRNVYLRRVVDAHRFDAAWRIISLVRDPIARNVSSFFQNLPIWVSGGVGMSIENLVEAFIRDFDHGRPLRWFDEEINTVFGIDAFEQPFPRERGFVEIEGDHAKLLVIRCEDLTRTGARAVADFLDLPDFELMESNLGRQKRYGDLYAGFLSRLRMPNELLDAMYESRYMTHFYSPVEIERFRARWSGS